MPAPLHAITLWQPWASAIIEGPKRVENRTWSPAAWTGPGPWWLAIHASLRIDPSLKKKLPGYRLKTGWHELAEVWPERTIPNAGPWPAGLLGLVRIDAVGPLESFADLAQDPWASGPVVWRIGQVWRLPNPIAMPGAQNLWRVPAEHLPALRALIIPTPRTSP